MIKKLFSILILLLIPTLSLSKEITKVISLSPAVTEIIFFTGNEKKLIADTTYCSVPEKAKKLKKVGGIVNPDIEKIVTLKPDIIITSKITPKSVIATLKRLKLKTEVIKLKSIGNIAEGIEKIGSLLGKGKEKKEEFIRKYHKEEKNLSPCIKNKKTLFVFSTNPIYTAGNSTFLGEIIKDAGGINLGGDGGYKTLSLEKLIKLNPDFVILTSMKNRKSSETFFENFNIKTVYINSDYILKPGPYIVEGIKLLRKKICNIEN